MKTRSKEERDVVIKYIVEEAIAIEMSIAMEGKSCFEKYIFSFYLYFTYNTKLILLSYMLYKWDSKINRE